MNSLLHLGWLANELAKDLPVLIPDPTPSARTGASDTQGHSRLFTWVLGS